MAYVLFDIGGTNTRVAVSDTLNEYREVVSVKTPHSFADGIEIICKSVAQLTDGPVRGVAGGIRGTLDGEKKSLAYDSMLTGWIDEPLAATLQKKLAAPVYLENDAAIAGLGEAHFGAGEGYDIVAYHTVSTGVGGAKIEHGEIDLHNVGFEPGRQVLDIDRTILGEDVVPTLENLVSGTAVEERMGQKPYDIPQSDALWDQLAYFLAHGLRNTVLYWSPDVIVLGGSMILGDPRIELSAVLHHANEVMGEEVSCPLIVDAELGDYAGIYGSIAKLRGIF